MINYEVALGQLELFVLILIRLASFVYAAPFFNTANVPNRFKIGFSLALSMIVYSLHPDMAVQYDNIIDYCIIVVQELIVGILLGAVSSFAVQIIQFSFFKYPVKITSILVADRRDHITDWQVRLTHQLCRLAQTLALEQFFEVKTGVFPDHLTQYMHRKMKLFAEFCQGRRPVLLLDIIQCRHGDHIFILVRKPHFRILHRFQKI